MAEKRQCMYCENEINKLNKNGYCSACFKANVNGIQSEYQKKYKTGSAERRVCANEGCDTKLRTDNKNGYCNPCFKSNKDGCRTIAERNRRTGSEDWQDKRCENPECRTVLMSNNTRGVCSNCYNANYNYIKTKYEKAKTLGYVPDKVRICKAEGCEKVLYENNKLGYCYECKYKVEGVNRDYTRVLLTGTAERDSCKECGVEIPLHNKSRYCAKCYHANAGGLRSADDRSIKRRMQKWTLEGIKYTDEDVQKYLEATACQICGTEFGQSSNQKRNLDHCHETGEVRGILCGKCNRAIGLLGDDLPNLLENVFHYYVQFSKKQGHKLNLIR